MLDVEPAHRAANQWGLVMKIGRELLVLVVCFGGAWALGLWTGVKDRSELFRGTVLYGVLLLTLVPPIGALFRKVRSHHREH